MERYLVIGSNSFSGSSFIRHALERGDQVVGVSRSEELAEAFLPYAWNNGRDRFSFAQIDLNKDLDRLQSVLHECQPDYVVNFAAQSMVAQSWENPVHWYQTNVVSSVALFEALRKLEGLKRYVHVSTPEVYGNCEGEVSENAPFNPSTPYAASRAACDLHLRVLHKQYNFPVVWTRAANVYGPGQQLYRIIPRTICFIKLGKKLPLHGGGASVRSFIHIRDVADATQRVAVEGRGGHTYHLSTDRFISIRDLVEMLCKRLGVAFEDAVDIADERAGKDSAYLLNSDKARTELHWKDKITLEDGIEETIQWVEKYWDHLKDAPMTYIHKQ